MDTVQDKTHPIGRNICRETTILPPSEDFDLEKKHDEVQKRYSNKYILTIEVHREKKLN